MLPELTAQVITPAGARRILALTQQSGCRPDPVDMDHARRLADDMTCGAWDDANPAPLALCSHGAVIRGLHRLHAVVISQVPRGFLMARGIPHRVRHVPGAKTRTAADALGALGVTSHRKEIAAAVHLVHLYEEQRDALPWEGWARRIFTNSETVRLLQSRYEDLPQFTPFMTALRSGLRSTPPASLAIAYLISQAGSSNRPLAGEFLQGLISASHLEPEDPRWDVRAWFLDHGVGARGRLASAHQLGLIITCWNAWIAGETRGEILFEPDDPMPGIRRIAAAPAPDLRGGGDPQRWTAPSRSPAGLAR
ncbi:hypothetical protein GT025_05830 [Streptomyces sp. SID4920]|nr:hypothetical protein [Streptomyces sp. SID4920]MYX63747.1 hypothetical protein [Streptomyces sp. SID8373]